MVEIGEAAVEPLIRIINDKRDYTRMQIVHTLGVIGDKRAVLPLENLLDHESNKEVRQVAVEALGRLNPQNNSHIKNKRIDIDKDVYVFYIGRTNRYFRASIANDILYLSQKDLINLKKGLLNPPIPMPYRYTGGKLYQRILF